MRLLASARSVLWAIFHRSHLSNDLDEELASHIQHRVDDLVRSGEERTEAERRARIEFGCYARYKEECQKASGSTLGETLFRDIRFGLRVLRKSPTIAAVAVVTLALGIGANTAIFSLVDGIWLRPLAISDPSHLLAIASVKGRASANSESAETGSSYPEYQDLRERVPAFADVASSSRRGLAIETGNGLQLLMAELVSDNYFSFMGVQPELGRLPDETTLRQAREPGIVLSHGTWKDVFGANADIIGQSVKVKGTSMTVLAVMPAEFRGTERLISPHVYVPQASWLILHPDEIPGRISQRADREYDVFARLRPGATLEQARGQLNALGKELSAKYPQANSGRSFTVDWQAQSAGGVMKTISFLLLAIAVAVLLIACTNLANLLLSLNDSRRREFAMRAALGAGRGQLLRQLITEYLVLATGGIVGAILLARWFIALTPALMPNVGFPLGFDFRIDHRVLAFTAVAGLVSVLACGLIPSVAFTQTTPLEAMRPNRTATTGLKMPARKLFVVVQLTASMALLVSAGLLIRTLNRLQNVDMGFNSKANAMLLEISVDQDGTRRQAEFEELVSRLQALPGVKDACMARVAPLPDIGGGATKLVLAPGEVPSPTAGTSVWFNWVSSGYFRVMGIPILRGRTFEKQDTTGKFPVTIVNQALAKKLFGTEDVVGKHFRIGREQPTDVEIVGIVRDGKYADVTEHSQPYLYLPVTPDAWSDATLVATTTGDPRALLPAARKVVRGVSPGILVIATQTLTDRMLFATYSNRLAAWLTTSFGALALLLTVIGLYGVMAYSVSRRNHEIGVRMALGERRESIFATVLTDGLKITLAGVALGMALAMLLGRGLSSLLYGVKLLDPVTLSLAAVLVVAASLAASIVPAIRALSVDPATILRE